MKKFLQFTLISVGLICLISLYFHQTSTAQTTRLTIPEVFKILNIQLPTEQFKSKDDVIIFLIAEISQRKIEAPLTADVENIFRQVGATDALIDVISKNNPTSPASTPTLEPISTPTPAPVETPTPTVTPTPSQTPNLPLSAFTIPEIRAELRKLAPDASQKDLITQIELRKVSGKFTADSEAILIQAKATAELIEAIKKNLVK